MATNDKQMQYRKQGFAASYLAACALHDRTPVLPEAVDLDELFKFCKFHSITAIVAMGLEMLWKEHPAEDDLMKPWRQARDMAIRKNILLNAERERILAHLESIGCWYMPLKGSLLQFDYPQFGMRQMSDNDILFDETKEREVYEFMTGSGYEAVTYRQGKDDVYTRKPLYTLEMHRSLFSDALNPELAEYYWDVKKRLVKDEGNGFGYHFTCEDFYIFMVIHAYKHFLHGGVGIRNLLDVHVYDSKYGAKMDWEYLRKELSKLGAWDFDQNCRSLGKKLFEDPMAETEYSQEELLILDNFFSSGTFGTKQQALDNRLRELTRDGKGCGKIRYILNRMFPSMALMKDRYPGLRKFPWLAPAFYLHRFFTAIFRREAIGQELHHLKNTKK